MANNNQYQTSSSGRRYVVNPDGTVTWLDGSSHNGGGSTSSTPPSSGGNYSSDSGCGTWIFWLLVIAGVGLWYYLTNKTTYINPTPTALYVSGDGGTEDITVKTDGKWDINVYPDSWASVTRNNDNLKISISKNSSTYSRSTKLNLKSKFGEVNKDINITQREKPYINLQSSTVNLNSDGDAKYVTVSSNEEWSISKDSPTWATVTKRGSELCVKATTNNSYSSRSGTVTLVAGSARTKLTIEQKKKASYLYVDETSVTFSSAGGSRTISVLTDGDWKISTNTASWGHLSNIGNVLTLTVDANFGASRYDYFEIKADSYTRRVSIHQNAPGPSADIKSVWVDHNYYYNGSYGMKIHIKFETERMQGKTGQINAYFYYNNDNPIKDRNFSYRTTDGNVSVGESFTPKYDGSTFNDYWLFIPYSELHLSGTSISCYLIAAIFYNRDQIATSEKYHFRFN